MPSTVKFQSPPPMREATQRINVIAAHGIFQSPPPMREATQIVAKSLVAI